MPTIKESAQKYEPKGMKNIADLEEVSTDINITEDEERTNQDGEKYYVSYIIIEGEEYRVPASVLEQLKTILEAKPDQQTFRVMKKGEGKGTKYTVVAL